MPIMFLQRGTSVITYPYIAYKHMGNGSAFIRTSQVRFRPDSLWIVASRATNPGDKAVAEVFLRDDSSLRTKLDPKKVNWSMNRPDFS